jgi:hypothetical protein
MPTDCRMCGLSRTIALLVIVASCAGSDRTACDPSAPDVIAEARRDSMRAPETQSMDAAWVELARTLPGGFAGMYYQPIERDARGKPANMRRVVIRLSRPDERDAALPLLLPRMAPMLYGLVIDTSAVHVVAARWDFAQLDEWRRYLDMRLALGGVTSSDTDEGANQVR